ncbi:MAG: LemA family protein, partial [Bacteroidota bacterium]
MKKWLPLIVILIIVFGIFRWGVNFNNTAIEKQETAKTQWAKVESAYQRRADLIPNLVNTVKGYASHEKETLEGVIQARANAT